MAPHRRLTALPLCDGFGPRFRETVMTEPPEEKQLAAAARPDPHTGALKTHGAVTRTTPAERNRAFIILFISLTCMGIGQSVVYTILPPLARQLSLSPLQVTSIFAVSAAIWVFAGPFWGRRSDRWGRKPVMLLGLAAFAISFAAFATSMLAGLNGWLPAFLVFPCMVASRVIFGTFGSGTSSSALAYVADRTAPHERLRGVAINGMAFPLGVTFGPIIGAVLALASQLAPFYFVSALALASAAAIWFFLPERTAPRAARRHVSTLRWYEPRMLPFVLFGLLLSLAGSIPTQTISFFIMDVLKQSPAQAVHTTSYGLMAVAVASLFAQFVIVQRLRISARVLTFAGLGIAVASNLLMLVAYDFSVVVLALMLSGLGLGMARPAFTSGATLAVAPHEQGAVAGILNSAGAAGFIFGPLVGWLYQQSPFVPFAFGAAIMLALLAAQRLSPVLYHSGDIPPDPETVEETNDTPLPKG